MENTIENNQNVKNSKGFGTYLLIAGIFIAVLILLKLALDKLL